MMMSETCHVLVLFNYFTSKFVFCKVICNNIFEQKIFYSKLLEREVIVFPEINKSRFFRND